MPDLSLAPTTVNFPGAAFGYATAPAAQTITISNSGDPANVSSIVLSGADASAFTLAGHTGISAIPTSGTANFTVRPILGLAVGTYNATITVTYNGGATKTATVSFAVSSSSGLVYVDINSTSTSYPDLHGALTSITAAGTYTVRISANQNMPPFTFPAGNAARNITLIADGTPVIIQLSSQGSLITIPGSPTSAQNVHITLGNGITLRGLNQLDNGTDNDAPVIRINGINNSLTMNAGSLIIGNTIRSTGDAFGGAVHISTGPNAFTMNGGEISGNAVISDTGSANGGAVSIPGTNSTFTMNNGKISGNTVSSDGDNFGNGARGGGVHIAGINSNFIMNGGEISGNTATGFRNSSGGGIFISGNNNNFTLINGEISNNTINLHPDVVAATNPTHGGGVFFNGLSFDISGGKITENTINGLSSADGGGVYIGGANSTFNMSGGEISLNTINGHGGGAGVFYSGSINPTSTFIITGGVISGNIKSSTSLQSRGGGVFINRGFFTMSAGEISENRATNPGNWPSSGGGVFNELGTFRMEGGTISGNSAEGNNNSSGGGVFIGADATFIKEGTATGGVITGHDAANGNVVMNVSLDLPIASRGHAVFLNAATRRETTVASNQQLRWEGDPRVATGDWTD
jgi:hypothetical protein